MGHPVYWIREDIDVLVVGVYDIHSLTVCFMLFKVSVVVFSIAYNYKVFVFFQGVDK